jgi:archaellum component FlaG (FlaF/FlaG flagellin family)
MYKEKQVLELLHDNNFKECRIINKPDNTAIVYKTCSKNGNFSIKDIGKAIREWPYQDIMLSIEKSNVVYIKQEKKYKC